MISQKSIDLIDAKFLGKKMRTFRLKTLSLGQAECARRAGKNADWLNRREAGARRINEEDLKHFFIFGCGLRPDGAYRLTIEWITEAMKARLLPEEQ